MQGSHTLYNIVEIMTLALVTDSQLNNTNLGQKTETVE